jgi:hypothetical protein
MGDSDETSPQNLLWGRIFSPSFHLVRVIIIGVTVVKTWIVMVMMVMMILEGESKIFPGN